MNSAHRFSSDQNHFGSGSLVAFLYLLFYFGGNFKFLLFDILDLPLVPFLL